MRLNAANNAETTLSQAVSTSDSVVIVDDASSFPDVPFLISINSEIMQVTSVSGNEFTVDRAQEGTTASSHDTEDSEGLPTIVENRFTAGTYEAIYDEIDEGATYGDRFKWEYNESTDSLDLVVL